MENMPGVFAHDSIAVLDSIAARRRGSTVTRQDVLDVLVEARAERERGAPPHGGMATAVDQTRSAAP